MMKQLLMWMPLLATTDFSFNNLMLALLIVVIAIILAVTLWRFVAPAMGQYAYIAYAFVVIVVLLIIAHVFGLI